MTLRERQALTAVARGDAPADLFVRGATLLDVYTGELYPAGIAVSGEWIARAGASEQAIGPRTRVIEARGRVVVPGYIDPHVHPAHVITPSALARHVLPLGTTTVVADSLQIWQLGGLRGFRATAAALARSPLRFYWMIRTHAQTRSRDEARRYRVADIARALAHPAAIALGEVTRWPEAWSGRGDLLRRLALACPRRLRIEGHAAGAKGERLPAIAAAGFTSDHEPITAAEVLDRARQGIAVMLRESSLRPDLREVLEAIKAAPALATRLMLTTDGSMPAFIRTHGFVDHLVRIALDRGVPPLDAYRMVTLNPATYFRVDDEVGGIAPGRTADLCILGDLTEPRPRTVIARGRVVAEAGRLLGRVPEPPWRRILTSAEARLDVRWRARAEDFTLPARARYPVIRLVRAAITQLEERPLAAGDLHAALLDRRGRWVAPAVVAGFADRVDGLASTITTDFNILVLGRDPESMALAVNRLLAMRGGVVLVEGGRSVCEMPLPLGGVMMPDPLVDVARHEEALRAALVERGYPHHEPLFTLFFLAADFLPAVRLTPHGVWDVKAARLLWPARRRGRRR